MRPLRKSADAFERSRNPLRPSAEPSFGSGGHEDQAKALLGLITPHVMLGAAAAYFGLGAADMSLMVGLDSQLSAVQEKALSSSMPTKSRIPMKAKRTVIDWNPVSFEEGEVYGECLRFQANEDQQLAYIQATLGEKSLTEDPATRLAVASGSG